MDNRRAQRGANRSDGRICWQPCDVCWRRIAKCFACFDFMLLDSHFFLRFCYRYSIQCCRCLQQRVAEMDHSPAECGAQLVCCGILSKHGHILWGSKCQQYVAACCVALSRRHFCCTYLAIFLFLLTFDQFTHTFSSQTSSIP